MGIHFGETKVTLTQMRDGVSKWKWLLCGTDGNVTLIYDAYA